MLVVYNSNCLQVVNDSDQFQPGRDWDKINISKYLTIFVSVQTDKNETWEIRVE